MRKQMLVSAGSDTEQFITCQLQAHLMMWELYRVYAQVRTWETTVHYMEAMIFLFSQHVQELMDRVVSS